MNRPLLMPAALVAAVLCISTAALFIRLCGDVAPEVIAAYRVGLAALMLGVFAVPVRGRQLLTAIGPHWRALVLSGVFLGLHFWLWIASLRYTSVISSVVIVTTNPIFVGLASWALFGERLGRRLLMGVALAAVGGAVIAVFDSSTAGGHSLYGDFLSLCGAIAASCYLLIGRRVRGRIDLVAYVLPVYAVAAVVLCGIAAWNGARFTGFDGRVYGLFVLLAVVPQLIGHSTFNWALRHVTATFVAVCILGEPIGASILAYLFLDEPPGLQQLAGSALILAGIALAALSRQAPQRAGNDN